MKKDDDMDEFLPEYWVLAIAGSYKDGRIHYRQFLAAGYYDAYNTVLTFTEKTYYKVMWFKEKRKCGMELGDRVLLNLEHVCTFCNNEFRLSEPILCTFSSNVFTCNGEFCSFNCREEHFYLKHIKRGG